jgi:uncharacterized cupin superfamily protein
MKKVNSNEMEEYAWASPKGRFAGFSKPLSEGLGRERFSTDLLKRHPFDVALIRIPPGKANFPYHSHSAQWEFYHILSGRGRVRDESGEHEVGPGDAFLYKPSEAHQLMNSGDVDLVMYVVADNPVGESCHYPDSGKWLVQSPERRVMRSGPVEYYDGEE